MFVIALLHHFATKNSMGKTLSQLPYCYRPATTYIFYDRIIATTKTIENITTWQRGIECCDQKNNQI
ncbi:hypothetical protein HanXRQr2_Chr15g0700141 [Helianthus annuus]|uniref:Uncharacterized protein n=1 Tax=Helianthus annuus TaxID=4232 RepID=A0A9K3H3K5_HELAN|nr:hypothetical protein HanXRQr2_Chr15g0700141 [Helianthus annuus]KAJ0831845.1 hypothetical protein HanPSC8_Chr15g0671841 [Helianthus annuus]